MRAAQRGAAAKFMRGTHASPFWLQNDQVLSTNIVQKQERQALSAACSVLARSAAKVHLLERCCVRRQGGQHAEPIAELDRRSEREVPTLLATHLLSDSSRVRLGRRLYGLAWTPPCNLRDSTEVPLCGLTAKTLQNRDVDARLAIICYSTPWHRCLRQCGSSRPSWRRLVPCRHSKIDPRSAPHNPVLLLPYGSGPRQCCAPFRSPSQSASLI